MTNTSLTNDTTSPCPATNPMIAALSVPTVSFHGVRIQAVTLNGAMNIVDHAVRNRQRLLIGVVNAAKLVSMRDNKLLRAAVTKANLILADGMSVVWACRLLGRRLPARVTGIDLMDQILECGKRQHYRIYFLGATDEVLLATLSRIRHEFPGVVIAGGRNGFFTAEQEPEVAAAIRAAKPDILLAGMSSPKKELFLARWFDRIDVPVCHGVGGAFDVFAGKVGRAPKLWQRLGLEWLYRVLQEPRRLWKRYLITNTLFAGLVLRELFHGSGYENEPNLAGADRSATPPLTEKKLSSSHIARQRRQEDSRELARK